jgi:putative hydrolase of the HAD superfamily
MVMKKGKIRNIIFDLGGVIVNLNPQLTVDGFRKLGWSNFYNEETKSFNQQLFKLFEKGNSSSAEFRDLVRESSQLALTDNQIDEAWNAMILDFPTVRIEYIHELKKEYRLFLLSNTNEIHESKFESDFMVKFGYALGELFEHSFYSHTMGLRKPNADIFQEVLRLTELDVSETLFIDDILQNTEGAQSVGLHVLHIEPGTLLERLPNHLKDLG